MEIARRSIAATSMSKPAMDQSTSKGGQMMSMDSTPQGMRSAMVEYPMKVNCADEVPSGGYLVTSDDFSNVKLFNYPVVADDAPYKCFRAHASHVMCVRFLCDDRRVISVGGRDRAVCQWRTLGVNQQDDAKVRTRSHTCWFTKLNRWR